MVRASLVIIVCITASLLAAAGPPPDENDSVGNVDWIGQYEASQEGPLATRGREVLDAYRKLLDTVDLDGQTTK